MSALLRRALGGCVVLAGATHGAYAQAQDDAATFEARAVAAPERGAGAASLDADDARNSGGAAGEPALALANLPGVARAGLASGELVIWGSPPADTRVYVDGIELPALFHPGGFRTTIHPALLSRLTLTPGAPGPALGGGLGGVVELETRDLDTEASHAAVDVTTMDSAALLHASLGPARAAWGVRVGYFDRLEPLLAPRSTAIVPLPAYADGIAKAEVDLGGRAQLTALWLGSHDRVVRGVEAVDPGSSRTQAQSRDLQLGYLRYSRAFDDGARIVLTPFVATHAHAESDRSGTVPWDLDVRELRYGLRAGYAMLTEAFDVRLGVDSSAVRSEIGRTGSLTLPPREGDVVVFGQPPGSGVSSDHFTTYDANVAPHAELTARFGRFVLSPGFRLDVHALSSSRARPTVASTPPIGFSDLQARPEPRVGLRYLVNDWLSGDARAGLTHQVAAPEDRSAVFGNPALGLARAWTLAAGPRARLLALVDVEATAFYKTLARLPARNPTQPVPLAQGLLARGTGDAYGAELLVRLRAWHGLSGQLGYTL
ncbi:MAG: TonB-dependent receptor domain-containing protein, partial [Polyangiales bacterium]